MSRGNRKANKRVHRKVDRALRRAMFSFPGRAGIINHRAAERSIHLISSSVVIFPGSARDLACWLRRLAATNFAGDQRSKLGPNYVRLEEFALASRLRGNARSRAFPRTERSSHSRSL